MKEGLWYQYSTPILDNFTTWLQKQGYKIETIQTHLEHSVKIDYFFHQQGIQCLTDLTHSDFEKLWQHYSQQHKRIASTVHRIKQFLEEAKIIKVPAHKEVTQTELELSRFVNFLRNVNGFSLGKGLTLPLVTASLLLGRINSVNTANKYAKMDLEMKRKALEKAKPLDKIKDNLSWRKDPNILEWLESL